MTHAHRERAEKTLLSSGVRALRAANLKIRLRIARSVARHVTHRETPVRAQGE
jgi:hypothetical protein